MFEAPGQPCPGGGITRVPQEEWAANRHGLSRKGVVLYLYVEDIKLWEEVRPSLAPKLWNPWALEQRLTQGRKSLPTAGRK